jgi:hypothetical protein
MDNFDLKKFLKENKALENLNPTIKSLNEGEAAYEYEKGKEEGEKIEKKKMTKEAMKKHIKDMIVAELEVDKEVGDDADANADLNDFLAEDDKTPEEKSEEDEALLDGGFGSFEEAKKDEEVEDVEDVEVTDTEEEMPAEEAPAATGGLEDISADMEGTEGDLMDHLMSAFKIAKGMGNEKLETQVGNTLKFFVSEYIGGGED